ncbi:caspase family protein [Botrimarina hoheduenensis]|uniref:Caspase domain protein n=1 Tax=Botrimarina hoheduenensis TaxID=2528000 RepID=A0A5C5WCL0_9BACT|nr:caspase family protein [Botrimarina hoheduenensis]TWT47853.1 Caspase domain protein [Botrimarina hoheduenensis]
MNTSLMLSSGLGRFAALLILMTTGEALSAVASDEAGVRHHALLIGVAAYDSEAMAPLPYAAVDAERLRSVLTERGDFQDALVTTLTTVEGSGTSREQITAAIEESLAAVGPEDAVLIYFSGHGDLASDGTLYLAPSDFQPTEVKSTGVSAAWLRGKLAGCKARAKLLVLDACHAGASDRGVTGENVLSSFDEAEGVVTLASSSAAQSSVMDSALEGSLFSFWLSKALSGHADRNVDGSVTVNEAFAYVDQHVTAEAQRRYGEDQSPRMSRNMAVTGDPTITTLRPQPLDVVLEDMASQIAWHAAQERFGVVGCLPEFTTLSWDEGRLASVLSVESGLAGKSLAERFQGKVKARLSERPNTMQLLTASEASNAVKNGLNDFVALTGEVRMQSGDALLLQASIVENGVTTHSVAGRAMVDDVDLWAEFGHSAVVQTADFQSRRDPLTGITKSAEAVAVATLDQRVSAADYQHPMADPAFGCQVSVRVPSGSNSYFVRNPVYREGRAYVALNKGETYEIHVDYDLQKLNEGRPVYAKILVDGVSIRNPAIDQTAANNAAQEENGSQAGGPRFDRGTQTPTNQGGPVFYKGVDLVRVAQHSPLSSLDLNQMWLFDGSVRPLRYQGFYYGPNQDALRFQVVDSTDSIGARRDYGQAVGMITVVLYDILGAGRGSDVGTTAGAPIAGARLRPVQAPGGVGRQLAVLHVHYCSASALSQLEQR